MSFVPSGPLVDLLRGWLVHVVGIYALISTKSRIAALDDVKTMAAELSDSDLSALDSWPLQSETLVKSTRLEEFTEADWDGFAKLYARSGYWSKYAGPDPMSRACKCPKSILEKHNIDLETGERRRFSPPAECE